MGLVVRGRTADVIDVAFPSIRGLHRDRHVVLRRFARKTHREVGRIQVLIGIARDLRNVETALGRVIEVSDRNIRRIHIPEAKIRTGTVSRQDNRVILVAVR